MILPSYKNFESWQRLFIFRMPHLLEVMCCVAVHENGKLSPSIIPVLAACYSILMKHQYSNLSAFHRLASAIAVEGGLNDRLIQF